MRKKIAIIGGSYLQLPAVLKAHKLGLEVHCFSWEEGAVCAEYTDYFYPISILEKERILSVCREIGVDGVMTIASDVAVIAVNYVAKRLGLVSNPEEYSLITTDKYFMRQCFSKNQLPSPRFCLATIQEYDIAHFSYPLIVKPTDRSGSRGVEKVYSSESVAMAVERACSESFTHTAIIEEYIGGREVSVESISFDGCHYVLAVTDKITTGAPFFVELEHHQPSLLSESLQNEIRKIVLESLTALHIQYGASHSELKITDDGQIFIIEIGARMGGDFIGSDLVQLSTGYDFLAATIKVSLGIFDKPIMNESHCSGVYFLSKETEYLRNVIMNASKYSEIVRADITDENLKNIECSSDRSGYLIYQSNKRFNL